MEDNKTCKNIFNGHPVDGFICSKCGLHIEDCSKIIQDEDEVADGIKNYFEYEFKYCPECGRKVVE